MREQGADAAPVLAQRRKAARGSKLWRRIRRPLAGSRFAMPLLARLMAQAFRFTYWSHRQMAGGDDAAAIFTATGPSITALWHGQHLLAPCINPPWHKVIAMFSRSNDAALNAMVAERLGCETVRGSGGRAAAHSLEKGGARALIALKKALDAGKSVVMIADIPHGTPREAGLGVVTLARLSGRPILPAAYASSRRKTIERSWDKTTINLPFGRGATVFGKPIMVARDADEAECERKRREVTESLNAVTARAYQLVDGAR